MGPGSRPGRRECLLLASISKEPGYAKAIASQRFVVPRASVRFQNASSDTVTATDQMTTAQSADQSVAVKKRTGRNESKLRVFARRPGWTLTNANAFHVAYSGQPNTALVAFTSTILIKWAPAIPRCRPSPMQPTSRKAERTEAAVAARPWLIGCG